MVYMKYVTEELNAHQRKKFRTIQSLVNILAPAYSQEGRTKS